MQTEFDFTLPRGYADAAGNLHRHGRIRLATALDEIEPMTDARVERNAGYVAVLLLSRVITQLGDLPEITPQVVEGLFAADLAYLQDMYLRLNSVESVLVSALCPRCQHHFPLQVAPLTE